VIAASPFRNALSRDAPNYSAIYDDATLQASVAERILHKNFILEPGYFTLQALSVDFLSYKIFAGLIIFLALAIKYLALKRMLPRPSCLVVLPWLLVLSFLHEGTQLRGALSLSVVFLAITFWVQDKALIALLLILLASLFHSSALIFILIFMLIALHRHFGVVIYWSALAVSALLMIPGLAEKVVMGVGEAINARYLNYTRGAISRVLNVSGLFSYFFLFPALLTAFVFKFSKTTSNIEIRIKELALVSGIAAVCVLQVLRFNTIIASRLADLLLFPVTLGMGLLLVQLHRNGNKRVLATILVILIGYCAARGYVTFSPRPVGPAPSIN
jgi:hypothetical protein